MRPQTTASIKKLETLVCRIRIYMYNRFSASCESDEIVGSLPKICHKILQVRCRVQKFRNKHLQGISL